MDVFQEVVSPTAVGLSVCCNFLSKEQPNLVVVKNTLLQIFKVHNNKLVLVSEFKLNGAVQTIKSIRLQNSELHQLLILTKFAKLSIIAWDHENYTITTQSLHYYESEFLKSSINKQETYNDANLRVEPNGACSLVQYNDILALLPFKKTDNDVEEVVINSEDDFFQKSVILPASSLEASVSSIIDSEFLFNYRDPTLAILYNKSLTWAGDLSIKKDTVNYVLLSLDLSNGSSTPILNIENLPYDSYEIIPLENPLNGSLLVGCNQIVHIDNSGNIKGIGTNSYFKDTTDLKLNDQSDLELFLEDCQIEVVSKNKMLIVDKKGYIYTLSFKVDGKVIKDLSISKVDETQLEVANPTTISTIGDLLFIGSRTSDAKLVKLSQDQTNSNTKDKQVADDHDDDEQLEEDDDLYDDNDDANTDDSAQLKFEVLDSLVNHGPISSFTLGKLSPDANVQGLVNPNFNDISIVATTGEHQSGSLTAFKPTIQPQIQSTLKFNNINKIWNLLDKYLLTTDPSNFKSEIFLINDNFKIFQSLDFKNNNITIHADTVFNNKRILQVTSSNIYLFDLNFKQLVQIKVNFEILSAHIFDPFVMIASSKGEIKIFEIEPLKGRKLNKVLLPGLLEDLILTSGTIAKTLLLNKGGVKRSSNDEVKETKNLAFLVTTVNNQILIFNKNHNEKVYQISQINKLSEISELTEFENPKGLIPDPFIKEIELLELGDENYKEEILSILTIGGELIFYKTIKTNDAGFKFVKLDPNLITGAPENIYSESTVLERKLVPLTIDEKNVLFVTGKQPYFILKTAQSLPKIFKFTSSNAIHICKLGTNDGVDTFMYIDNQKNARICSLNTKNNEKVTFDYSNNLPIMRVNFGVTLNNVTFHETSNLFIASSLHEIPYIAKDEEELDIVGTEPDKPKAENYKSTIKMIEVKDWEIIDEIIFEDNTVVNDIKTENLIISTRSKKTKEFLIFGIGKYRLEDLSVYGEYNIQEILSIVPDPTKPNVNFKFKQIAKESFKGAVTKVGQVAGRFLTGQAQKILIRRLQQDYSVVPNAFYDTASYVSEFKSFRNLLLIGDTLKSILLLGFDAEPDRLILLGKDLQDINISSADFIVDNGEIYFLLADDEENVHLLSYQPDDPKSLNGQILIRKSTFKVNSMTTTMRMLPKHEEFKTGGSGSFQTIGSNIDGSIYKVTPVDEATFRRLYILQQQLSDKMPHFAGLNARANRYAENEAGFKPILEFDLLKYWFLWLNVDKRQSTSSKVGRAAYLEIWKDLIEVQNTMNVLNNSTT